MKNFARKLLFFAFVLLGTVARATTITITVGDNFYSPQTVSISPGDVVTWQYQAGSVNSHPTASDNAAWATFTINSANVSKSLTFASPGSFPYHCEFHGGPNVGMYGLITVAKPLAVPAAQLTATALRVFPNPARETVTLQVGRALPQAAHTLQLLDPLGRLVRTQALRPDEIGRELAISLAGLPAGLYYYRLLAGTEALATQRLVVLP